MTRTCDVPECGRPHQALGKCWRHYQQLRLRGYISDERVNAPRPCGIPGCEGQTGHKAGGGWCRRHYMQWLRYGDPLGSLIGRAYSRLNAEKREQYAAAGREIRAHIRAAMTANAIGDHAAVRRFLQAARSGGRPLTKPEREVVEAITPNKRQQTKALRHQVAALTRAGKSSAEIAKLLGVSPRQIHRYRAASRASEDRNGRIIEMYTAGMAPPDIARSLGLSINVTWGVVRRYRAALARPDATIGNVNGGGLDEAVPRTEAAHRA